jgi:hypothetical protein
MPGTYHGLDGRALTQRVREDIARAGVTMDVTAAYDHQPAEYRARVRAEQTGIVKQARAEGRAALTKWAEAAIADANKRLHATSVGSPAEESRRVAEELRITRMVDSARANNNARSAAEDIADRADRAFASGDHDEAMVLARAASELGSRNALVPEIIATVQLDRDLADPAKARAMRDIADVGVVVAAFDRDVNATVSQSLQDAAKLARALGDNATGSQASVTAKLEAFYGSRAFGDGKYADPVGVLPGGPTGEVGGKLPAGSAS